jgi:hypothetical protein
MNDHRQAGQDVREVPVQRADLVDKIRPVATHQGGRRGNGQRVAHRADGGLAGRAGPVGGVGFQHGDWQDAMIYSLLRGEVPGQRSAPGTAG